MPEFSRGISTMSSVHVGTKNSNKKINLKNNRLILCYFFHKINQAWPMRIYFIFVVKSDTIDFKVQNGGHGRLKMDKSGVNFYGQLTF